MFLLHLAFCVHMREVLFYLSQNIGTLRQQLMRMCKNFSNSVLKQGNKSPDIKNCHLCYNQSLNFFFNSAMTHMIF